MTRPAVLGLGLIGGSLSLALGARGWDRDPQVRRRASERGLDVADTLESAVAEARVVFLAVPTADTHGLLLQAAAAQPEALLSDCASLKGPVARAADGLPAGARLVGGHPMAGSRTRGLSGADAGLFCGRPWILVPTSRSDDRDLALIRDLVTSVGAKPIVLDADRHDAAMTRISHLPHAVSAALAAAAVGAGTTDPASLAGPGLLDATRPAESPVALQLELALADPGALSDALDDIVQELGTLAGALRRRDAAAVRAFFERAGAARARIIRA